MGTSVTFGKTLFLCWRKAGPASRLSPTSASNCPKAAKPAALESASNQTRAAGTPALPSPFHSFMRWSEWLHGRVGRTDSIALVRLMELLFDYLTGQLNLGA